MATIGHLNSIYKDKGPQAAADYARASIELAWAAVKIEQGKWNPDGKPKPHVSKRENGPRRATYFPPRIGKTVRTGGRTVALARKKIQSEKDRALRAKMRGKTNGGGKSHADGRKSK